jgi:hypothetical protein
MAVLVLASRSSSKTFEGMQEGKVVKKHWILHACERE